MSHAQLASAAAAGALSAAAVLLGLYRKSPRFARRFKAQTVVSVPPPNPDYQPGDPVQTPFTSDTWLPMDPDVLDGSTMYPFVISSVVPRPIAFVSSLSKEGNSNLAPYSYFNIMSQDPPVVVIGCAKSPGRPQDEKDTLLDIMETGEFVVNIISEWFVEAANHCSGAFDRGVSEFELANLTPLPSVRVKPPRVKESAVHFECKLLHTYEIKNKKGIMTETLVVGEVRLAHVHEDVATKSPHGKTIVDITKYRPVARLGGPTYSRVTETFDLPRPGKEWQEKQGVKPKHS